MAKKKAQDGADKLKGQLARALADYDNLQKRVEKDQLIREKMAAAKFVYKLLPVVDMLEGVQGHVGDSGLGIAMSELKEVIKEEGYEEVAPKKGDKFDETWHEVVDTQKGGKKGLIAKLALSGWKMGDTVIRPAKVEVYK